MHNNPQTHIGAFFALSGHRLIQLVGPDAAAFAQAQFINDVTTLSARQWHWSGWLTPKGRLIAVFALLKHDEQDVWLLLPDGGPGGGPDTGSGSDAGADSAAAALAAALRRFVFRSKVRIEVREDLLVSGAFQAPVAARGNAIDDGDDSGVEFDMGGDGSPRCLRIGTRDAAAAPEHAARWSVFDIEHGLPRLPAEQREQWTPQQLSLDRLRGFSVKKGCYPGQEIVARTHFLGKAKRGLVLLEADAPLTAGVEVRAGDKLLGTVVSVASAGRRHLGLAVSPLGRDSPASTAGDIGVRETPISGGLARS